jgi:hypothetical protein
VLGLLGTGGNLFIPDPDRCTHTGPVIAVNNRNYVFDVYPPGTDFDSANKLPNGTFKVHPPTRDGSGTDMSLQWRRVDHLQEVQSQVCPELGGCRTVTPILCLLDETTPAPTQQEIGCPATSPHPSRLRVILPFADSDANIFAQTIWLGWDDVPGCPDPPLLGASAPCAPPRTFEVRLHELKVLKNGNSFPFDGKWFVWADVGGQWRFVSAMGFDRNSDGDNVCEGDSLFDNGDDDCFRYDGRPWTVTMQDGSPLHVAVGGYNSKRSTRAFLVNSALFNVPDADGVDGVFCPIFVPSRPTGCDPNARAAFLLAAANDERIGTMEFDITPPDYRSTGTLGSRCSVSAGDARDEIKILCDTDDNSGDEDLRYTVDFRVRELLRPPPPARSNLTIGQPHFGPYVTSRTPLTLSWDAGGCTLDRFVGFQYRSRLEGGPLPTFAPPEPQFPPDVFPVHWTNTGFQLNPCVGARTADVLLADSSAPDGRYIFQFSAQRATLQNHVLRLLETEPRHTAELTLDNTPPAITIRQPEPIQYVHSARLELDFDVSDGSGSGVASVDARLDGSSTLSGLPLTNHRIMALPLLPWVISPTEVAAGTARRR